MKKIKAFCYLQNRRQIIMAKKDGLSQRDRRQLSRQKAREAEEAAEAEEALQLEKEKEAENLAKSEEIDTQMPKLPHERILIWFYHFYVAHLSPNIFCEFGILAITAQQAYLAVMPTYLENEIDVNLLVSSACGLLAFLFALFIIYKSRETLPNWNTVYLLFLPSLLCFLFDKDLLLYNVSFTMASLDLPIIAKFFIQFTVIGSNSDYGSDTIFNSKLILLHLIINYSLYKISELKSWDLVENNLFSILITDLFLIKSEQYFIILLQKLLISFSLSLLVVYTINLAFRNNDLIRSILIAAVWPVVFVYSSLYQLNPILNNNSFEWLYNFITVTEFRTKTLSVWLISLLLIIPLIFSFKGYLSSNFRRKIWHFLIFILIIYPLYADLEFVQFCLAGTLIVFLIIEMFRYLNLYPLGETLNKNLKEFADSRDDKGPILISYIYLLIGVSIPIFINGSPIGLIFLGIGDSFASIIGKNFGLIKWSNSEKTFEGTTAFTLSTYLVSSILKYTGLFFTEKSYNALLIVSTLSGLIEGSSDMNDNILIPGFILILLECVI